MQKILALLTILLLTLAVSVFAAYLSDIRNAFQRVSGQSQLIESTYGTIEYTRRGSGIPVLVIHGAGGGYDQGELIAETVLDSSFDIVTPSRFGYLGSDLPDNATWDDQAHAYALLLDHLAINRVAVVAMSQGGASALMFAVLYPHQISSLSCLSCGVAPAITEADATEQARADRQGNLLTTLFQRDFPYWFVSRVFRSALLGVIGANKHTLNGMTAEQQQLARRFISEMNPVSRRADGVVFDNKTPLPGDRIDLISAPTLIVHAKDDTLQLYRNAVFASSTIAGAQLMSFEQGGHLVAITEQTRIRATLLQHITENHE